MNEGHVRVNMLKEGLCEIEFFHPKHNSLPGDILAELAATIQAAGNNDEVQVLSLIHI